MEKPQLSQDNFLFDFLSTSKNPYQWKFIGVFTVCLYSHTFQSARARWELLKQ